MKQPNDPQTPPRRSDPGDAPPTEAAADAPAADSFDPANLEQDDDRKSNLVCHCMVVYEATIRRAIAHGAADLETLCEWSHAGLGCGTCRFDLEDMLAEPRPEAVEGGGEAPKPKAP